MTDEELKQYLEQRNFNYSNYEMFVQQFEQTAKKLNVTIEQLQDAMIHIGDINTLFGWNNFSIYINLIEHNKQVKKLYG